MSTLIEIAREFINAVKADLDPYTTRKGEVHDESATAVVLLTPSHIQWAKYGRGPGRMPPIDPIEQWVKDKGIATGKEARGTAWAIAKSIAKYGTSFYLPNAPNALEESLSKYKEHYLKNMAEAFTIAINDQIKEIKPLPKYLTW